MRIRIKTEKVPQYSSRRSELALSAFETESLASTIILPFLICTPRQLKGTRVIGQDEGNFSEIKTANVPPLDPPHTGQIRLSQSSSLAHSATENIKNFSLALYAQEKFWAQRVGKSRVKLKQLHWMLPFDFSLLTLVILSSAEECLQRLTTQDGCLIPILGRRWFMKGTRTDNKSSWGVKS